MPVSPVGAVLATRLSQNIVHAIALAGMGRAKWKDYALKMAPEAVSLEGRGTSVDKPFVEAASRFPAAIKAAGLAGLGTPGCRHVDLAL
jgi:hypothetical protein